MFIGSQKFITNRRIDFRRPFENKKFRELITSILSISMFADIHKFVQFRESLLVRDIGPDGYPVPVKGYGDYSNCVKPVPPEGWLAAYTNTIDKVDLKWFKI